MIEEKIKDNTEVKDYKELLKLSRIDIKKKYDKPPIVLSFIDYIRNKIEYMRVCTLGNFSCIKGKAKSKKTFLLSMIVSPLINNNVLYGKIKGTLPENKKVIVWFDTEQGEYDSYIVYKRIVDLSQNDSDYFRYYNLREFSPFERCEIIEVALNEIESIGFVIIDGIADLATAINDEDEATRVIGLLLKWTKIHNIHICNIIHENKNNNFATGHLGSSVMKKAETLMTVELVENETVVSCDRIRGTAPFDDFNFEIDQETYLPKITNSLDMERTLTTGTQQKLQPNINFDEPLKNKIDDCPY